MKKNAGSKFLSDLKLYTDYFKWSKEKDRYENWNEACEDIINGHIKKYGDCINHLTSNILESLKEQRILASQRNLQFRYDQIMKHNARMYNCCTLHLCRPKAFQEIFYLGLCGCGVGISLLKPFVNNLPEINVRSNGTKTFVIEDSIEGWADSLGVLLSSYFSSNQPFPEYSGYEIKFDYSLIREQGSFISGGFKAPGPNGLKAALEKIEKLIDNLVKSGEKKLKTIDCYDIICHASDAVLSGGVRRSALSMIIDPNDKVMMYAKVGNWRMENPQRARSNNSVLIFREKNDREFFDSVVSLNEGDNDLGFVFCNTWFDVFNPCFEIGFTPVNTTEDIKLLSYEMIEEWTHKNINLFGVQMCNLNEINAEKCQNEKEFLRACRDASALGTFQAGYTNFPYLGENTENLVRREALLGVSITGILNNPKIMLNPELLRKGCQVVVDTNKEVADIININQAARTTCVKPSGNASVVLQTGSGAHAEHSYMFFRVMQLNKDSDTAKWLEQNMSFLLEESVWSANNTDFVVFVPITTPKDALIKDDVKGVKHLEIIKLIQQNWIIPGTNRQLGICPDTTHNCSCTVIIDNKEDVVNYIWNNRKEFTAISFLSDFGDKDFNQAPFTSVLTFEEICQKYGRGSLFASGLIIDGLHYFKDNLWQACDSVLNKDIILTGTREQVLLKKSWVQRAKKFAKNYFKGDLKTMVYCLKDVHLYHKWETINREIKEVDFSQILTKPTFKDVSEYSAMACNGNSCEIIRL